MYQTNFLLVYISAHPEEYKNIDFENNNYYFKRFLHDSLQTYYS